MEEATSFHLKSARGPDGSKGQQPQHRLQQVARNRGRPKRTEDVAASERASTLLEV